MDLVEYLDEKGRSPFENWFKRINAQAAAKVTTALVRLEGGNTSAKKQWSDYKARKKKET